MRYKAGLILGAFRLCGRSEFRISTNSVVPHYEMQFSGSSGSLPSPMFIATSIWTLDLSPSTRWKHIRQQHDWLPHHQSETDFSEICRYAWLPSLNGRPLPSLLHFLVPCL